MTQSGWRKPTPGLGKADQLAQAGEQKSGDRTRCIVAVKRVGAQIGLKAADLLLLDTLAAFTQPQDWDSGRRPLVWASNAYLMGQTGFSLSTLKRHARRLAEVGVIAFKDSPNGKRWGHRGTDGHIVEAYGFDLSPLAVRVEEFEALAAKVAAERAASQALRRQITITRRMIRARIETALSGAFNGSWPKLARRFQDLLDRLPRPNDVQGVLAGFLEQLEGLLCDVEAMFAEAEDRQTRASVPSQSEEMTPMKSENDPHIQITKQPYPLNRNSSETEETRNPVPTDEGQGKDRALNIELAVVMQACPGFATWVRDLGGYLHEWRDVLRIAGDLRPMIGISDDAWTEAQARLGPAKSAAALALIFEKFNAGEVSSPGGYLRGMVARSATGELHIERSFYGRLGGQAA